MTRYPLDIELHIEELVLHDVPATHREAIAAQLVAALEPALADHGLGAWAIDGATIDHLAAPLEPAAATTPPGPPIGRAIAVALR